MVTGWRRAFCTSIPKERDGPVLSDKNQQKQKQKQKKQQQQHCSSNSDQSPRFGSKFGFFSNPSTPRLQSQPVSSPSLRCKTTSSVPNSPKLQCKTTTAASPKKTTNDSPKLSLFSNPSSPKSPSSFSFLKTSLGLSKSRCGICFQSVKTGQGTAIFTAECSHSFHFPCIANHLKKNHQLLTCPICNSHWKQVPVLSLQNTTNKDKETKTFKVYNDDEPLVSPISLSHFNPIPESEEEEFQGFLVTASAPSNLGVSLLQESAVIAVGRSYETYAMVLKIRAPPYVAVRGMRRSPVDLVTVVDVSLTMSGPKLHMMKRAMRLVISSLSSSDRLSIVAFSNASKRLLPLRRMTTNGRRSARRIVDALCVTGQGMCANDALKKAAKVLEDRREKNPFSSILILSEAKSSNESRSLPSLSSTRFSQADIPVHTVGFNDYGAANNTPDDEAFLKCVGDLLSVVVQDLKLQLGFMSGSAPAEIAAVYSLTGRPAALGSGSIRLGDLYAEEERELLIELKVPASSIGAHHVLSVRSSYKDPSSQELIRSKEQAMLAPRPQAVRSSSPSIARLRNLHVSTRAVAESRRLMELDDLSGAYHLLSSARALLAQRSSNSADEYLRGLDGELAELHRRRQQQQQQQSQNQRQRISGQADEKPEPLTPTSAWRAAERLAKVAIMRKHMNRVSDLHGFENARF
ncbi:Zinc finger C3HC4-type RING finger family protein [Melia azedarach]|uniref:Zinc finger C3HC4-type RING finger family protein n=1 Tax=Melia azedarach TaxID=155640 RepID=A0ACC1XV65_MELAZ|nr:Zinc finger C3HC4-type RING finger family protein [Melia azedarach]